VSLVSLMSQNAEQAPTLSPGRAGSVMLWPVLSLSEPQLDPSGVREWIGLELVVFMLPPTEWFEQERRVKKVELSQSLFI
jgi:hypothetical protein